jgi:hypothetical protein
MDKDPFSDSLREQFGERYITPEEIHAKTGIRYAYGWGNAIDMQLRRFPDFRYSDVDVSRHHLFLDPPSGPEKPRKEVFISDPSILTRRALRFIKKPHRFRNLTICPLQLFIKSHYFLWDELHNPGWNAIDVSPQAIRETARKSFFEQISILRMRNAKYRYHEEQLPELQSLLWMMLIYRITRGENLIPKGMYVRSRDWIGRFERHEGKEWVKTSLFGKTPCIGIDSEGRIDISMEDVDARQERITMLFMYKQPRFRGEP